MLIFRSNYVLVWLMLSGKQNVERKLHLGIHAHCSINALNKISYTRSSRSYKIWLSRYCEVIMSCYIKERSISNDITECGKVIYKSTCGRLSINGSCKPSATVMLNSQRHNLGMLTYSHVSSLSLLAEPLKIYFI